VFIEDGWLGRPKKVVNIRLVPQHVFHDVLFLHFFTAVHLSVLDYRKSLNINYLFATIYTFEKFKSNRIQDVITHMSFDGGVGVHLFTGHVWWTPIPLVLRDYSGWCVILKWQDILSINVLQVGEVVLMAVLVWFVLLDFFVSINRGLDRNSLFR